MDKLEERLDEAYNDLEEVEKLFDTLTQDEPERIDYCIIKRNLVCKRISLLLQEIKLDKQYIKKETVCRQTNTVSLSVVNL